MTSDYKKLFVVGNPRSGTSWLKKTIGQHPSIISVPSESQAYLLIYEQFKRLKGLRNWTFKKRLQCWKRIIKQYGFLPILTGIKSNDLWSGIFYNYEVCKKKEEVGLHFLVEYSELEKRVRDVRLLPTEDVEKAKQAIGLLFDDFFYKKGGNKEKILLEKTPYHLRYVDVILHQFPEAKVVEIIRDGRDVAVSYMSRAKTKKWADKQMKEIIKDWKCSIKLGDRFRANESLRDRIHLVRYEQLRRDTKTELKKVFDFAELSYDETLIDRIIEKTDIKNIKKKGEGLQVRKGAIGEWRSRLSETDIALWKELAGDTLVHLGYDLE